MHVPVYFGCGVGWDPTRVIRGIAVVTRAHGISVRHACLLLAAAGGGRRGAHIVLQYSHSMSLYKGHQLPAVLRGSTCSSSGGGAGLPYAVLA